MSWESELDDLVLHADHPVEMPPVVATVGDVVGNGLPVDDADMGAGRAGMAETTEHAGAIEHPGEVPAGQQGQGAVDDEVERLVIEAMIDIPDGSATTSDRRLLCSEEIRLPGMPEGFYLRDGKVRFRQFAKGADFPEELTICGALKVIAYARNADGTGWARIIEGTDRDGCTQVWQISEAMLGSGGRPVIRELRDRGFWIAGGRNIGEKVVELISGWNCDTRLTFARQRGWQDEAGKAFMLPSNEVVGIDGYLAAKNLVPIVRADHQSKGSVQSWRDGVAALCIGNPLAILAVSAAFAGPLLRLVSGESGGLHFRGASSSGKTTLQHLANSVWGPWGVHHSWRATANALELLAAGHNDLPLILDEMAEISGADLYEALYMLGNGCGKARMKDGERLRKAVAWRVMVISSGEIAAAEHLASAGKAHFSGQEVRLLDISAESRAYRAFDALHGAEDGKAFAELINQRTKQNFGIVGRHFVDRIIRDRSKLDVVLPELINRLTRVLRELPGVTDGPIVGRAATRLAVIFAAGIMASHYGLTGWRKQDILQAMASIWRDWLENVGMPDRSGVEASLARIRAFVLSSHDRFHRPDADRPIAVRGKPAGWLVNGRLYLPRETWDEVHNGHDGMQAARDLAKAGILLPADGDNLACKLPRRLGTGRAYTLDLKTLDLDATGNVPVPEAVQTT